MESTSNNTDAANGAKKILIIDDETALALLYKDNLASRGYIVEYCGNGDSALQVAKDFMPDLIILDMMMPNLSGYDCIELLKTLMPNKQPYIIILSALSQPQDIEKAKNLGADEYIVKSDAPMSEVIEHVVNALDASPAEPDLEVGDKSL